MGICLPFLEWGHCNVEGCRSEHLQPDHPGVLDLLANRWLAHADDGFLSQLLRRPRQVARRSWNKLFPMDRQRYLVRIVLSVADNLGLQKTPSEKAKDIIFSDLARADKAVA